MMSSGKARRENAELVRRVKRRPQSLQRKRWPPRWVVPSLVTLTDSQRGHDINTSSWSQPTRPTLLQENRSRRGGGPKLSGSCLIARHRYSSVADRRVLRTDEARVKWHNVTRFHLQLAHQVEQTVVLNRSAV